MRALSNCYLLLKLTRLLIMLSHQLLPQLNVLLLGLLSRGARIDYLLPLVVFRLALLRVSFHPSSISSRTFRG
jgi:hypothetical protein